LHQKRAIKNALICCLLAAAPACASELASATYTFIQINPTTYQYDLTLNDIGSTNIGTFWFSWIPGEDFMPVNPTNILSPASWTPVVTHAGGSDGYAIQWVAGAGSALTPGASFAGFDFDSTATPDQMADISPFFDHPVTTSVVYSQGPFSDGGFQLTAQAQTTGTPEPASFSLLGLGVLVLAATLCGRRASIHDTHERTLLDEIQQVHAERP
jgi:hypothetical protein